MIYKYKIIWSPTAYKEFQKIYTYIKYHLKEEITANNTSKMLLKSISNLSYFPEKYPKIQSLPSHYNSRNVRKMQINMYIIIYEIDANTR